VRGELSRSDWIVAEALASCDPAAEAKAITLTDRREPRLVFP